MRKIVLIVLCLVLSKTNVMAQQDVVAAYEKFMQLTSLFHGAEPYSCDAIVEVKYKGNANIVRDTSRLIYKNGLTYYKSRLVERVEASQGELIINHELKTASFQVSDSIKLLLQKELDIQRNTEFESMLDSNFESRDLNEFKIFATQQCNVSWNSKDGLDEISFTPKNAGKSPFLSIKIRFGKDSRIRYYEYTNREAYATDWDGSSKIRLVTTIYDNFTYNNVPDIPSKLSDLLEWNGWTIKLKRYTNYKLSLL